MLSTLILATDGEIKEITKILGTYFEELCNCEIEICEEDGIFELRAQVGNNISRVMYFFFDGGNAILTHGFIKKTQYHQRI